MRMPLMDSLISRLNVAKKRISELEDMWTETSTSEKQRGESKNKQQSQNRVSENYGTTTEYVYA